MKHIHKEALEKQFEDWAQINPTIRNCVLLWKIGAIDRDSALLLTVDQLARSNEAYQRLIIKKPLNDIDYITK